MKESIYFRHDYNSQSDPKMIKLRMKYGREGYGLFWAVLEVMREEANVMLLQCECNAIAYRLHCEDEFLHKFLEYCVEIGLLIFDKTDKSYYSERLQDDVEHMRSKSKKAKDSANSRRKKKKKCERNANASETHSEGNAIKDKIIEDMKIEETIEEETKKEISDKSETSLRSDEVDNSFNPPKNEKPLNPKKTYGDDDVNFVSETISKNGPGVISDTQKDQKIYGKHIAEKLIKAYGDERRDIFSDSVRKISGDQYIGQYLGAVQDTYRNIGKIISKAKNAHREVTYPIEMDMRTLTFLDKQEKSVCLEVVSALNAKKNRGINSIKYEDIIHIVSIITKKGDNNTTGTGQERIEPYTNDVLQKKKDDLIKKSSM